MRARCLPVLTPRERLDGSLQRERPRERPHDALRQLDTN
jgi:hypothetical protein